MIIILIILLSILSAILYRAGGMGQDPSANPTWMPMWLRHGWIRDWICPICALLPLFIVHPSWLFLIAYPALAGMLTTYWDWLFGFDNFWFSGFMCGIVGFMLIWCGYLWWLLLIRAFFIAILWGVICTISGKDTTEEYSRGFFLSISSVFLVL